MNAVIIIPTVDPDERLGPLIGEMRAHGFSRFVVVDDGSDSACDALFAELERDGVRVLHHAANFGKGAALKTGLSAVRTLFPEATHVVAMDDDGQHLPDDVASVCRVAESHRAHVVIGIRKLGGKGVPMRSRIGNAFSSAYFRFDTGVSCPDTQTGLRAMPISLVPFALSVPGTRYEYEMNLLTAIVKRDIPLVMTPISAVYENRNAGSHFSTVRDSLRIYRQLVRFASSSLACSAVDLSLFALATALFDLQTAMLVCIATLFARLSSGALNFTLNRRWSFSGEGSRNGDVGGQALRYGTLFVGQMIASMTLVTMFAWLPIPLVGVKMLVDGTLFVMSYFIQRNWVFKAPAHAQPLIVKGAAYARELPSNSSPVL